MKLQFKRPITMRRQILVLFVLLMLIPFILLVLIADIIFTTHAQNDLKTIYNSNVTEMANSLDTLFTNATDLTLFPLTEDSMRTYLTMPSSNPDFLRKKQKSSNIRNLIPYGYREGILSIGLYREDGDYIITDNTVKYTEIDYENVRKHDLLPFWYFPADEQSIFLLRHFRNPTNFSEYAGYIKLRLSLSYVTSKMSNHLQNEETSYFLITPNNSLLIEVNTGQSDTLYQKFSFTYEELKQKAESGQPSTIQNNCIISQHLLSNGLILYSIAAPHIISEVRHAFWPSMLMASTAVMLLSFMLSFYFSKKITIPLETLGEKMTNLTTENFSSRADIEGCQEISMLTDRFNNMAGQLEILYNKVYLGELKLKQSQLDVLETQINPHFLYNTLDTIYWMAKLGETEKVSLMVSNLSQMMQMTLSAKTKDKVTLFDELKHLTCYIVIQDIRHNGKILFDVKCNDDIKGFQVLSFLLQPLVENALHHGLSSYSNGIIHVHIYRSGNDLIYEVANNGTPINPDEITTLLNSGKPALKGFALKNIIERLQLRYGEPYSLTYFLDGDFSVFRINQPIEGDENDDKNTDC